MARRRNVSRRPTHARRFSEREASLIKQRIDDRLGDAIAVDDLASLLDLSVPHLMRAFKANFGTTPWQYVLRARLARTMHLLDTTPAPITQIVAETGFASPSHLTNAFARHFGVTSSAFRRRG